MVCAGSTRNASSCSFGSRPCCKDRAVPPSVVQIWMTHRQTGCKSICRLNSPLLESMRINFLNSADSALEHLIGPSTFDESLLLNILFQNAVVLHEAHFFNSGLLRRHATRTPGFLSLFEHAARRGLILPAFRDKQTDSLSTALDNMRKEPVYGTGWMERELRDNDSYVRRIVASVDEGMSHAEPLYWPENVSLGEGYKELVVAFLGSQDPPQIEAASQEHLDFLGRVWESTRKWRIDCVQHAIDATARKGGAGLQRTEVYRSLGAELGFEYRNDGAGREAFHKHCADDEQRLCVDVFMRWLAQCHHINMARALEVSVNFPAYDLDSDIALDSLVRTATDAPIALHAHGFRAAVCFPSLDELLRMSPEEIVAIRSDLGIGYMQALASWQSNPSEVTRDTVERCLQDYCHEICARVDARSAEMTVTFSPGSAGQLKQLRKAGAAEVINQLPIPGIGTFVSATRLVTATYHYLKTRSEERMRREAKRELELNLRAPLPAENVSGRT